MRVIGTAGHVDHGKSTLVAALTGIHPDRLKEEQLREMTIELGFAWMTLPDGESIGIVDVPGHRDFIENMLAGVGGIDAALFVVAADEGVMPQTREHLAILDILQVQGGVIALTKCDLMDDPDWLDLVESDVREAMRGTVLAEVPIVRVSARTGSGLDELKRALAACLAGRPARPDLGRPRLPVDRVFTMAGFGTVVTGTLADGQFHIGDEVVILPDGQRGRIRGLQTHKQKAAAAAPGSRTAVNISGVDLDQVQRGDVVALPGRYQPSQRLDVYFRLLPDASGALRHSHEVKFFIGAAEVAARVRLLGVEELLPGQAGWLQLEVSHPVVAVGGDHYILRRPSPGETLGGGVVVNPHPGRRHKRFSSEVLQQLEALRQGSPADVLLQAWQTGGILSVREAVNRARLSDEQSGSALQELLENGLVVMLETGGVVAAGSDYLAAALDTWNALSSQSLAELQAYHLAYPLRRGMPREELKSRLKLAQRPFNAALRLWAAAGNLQDGSGWLALPEHRVQFSPQQQVHIDRLLARFAETPEAPPTLKECQAAVGEEASAALIDSGVLVQVSPEVVFLKSDYDRLRRMVEQHLAQTGSLTVAQFRDWLNSSRRYALAFLEHLDAVGLTMRDGDVRKLRR